MNSHAAQKPQFELEILEQFPFLQLALVELKFSLLFEQFFQPQQFLELALVFRQFLESEQFLLFPGAELPFLLQQVQHAETVDGLFRTGSKQAVSVQIGSASAAAPPAAQPAAWLSIPRSTGSKVLLRNPA